MMLRVAASTAARRGNAVRRAYHTTGAFCIADSEHFHSKKLITTFDLPDPSKLMTYSDGNTSFGQSAPPPPPSGTSQILATGAGAGAPFSTLSSPPTETTTNPLSPLEVPDAAHPTFANYQGDAPGSVTGGLNASSAPVPSPEDHQHAPNVQKWTPPLIKIVGTIGPTSEQLDVMQDLVSCGLRVMRLNFSHATVEEVELRVKNLRLCQGRHAAAMATRRRNDEAAPDGHEPKHLDAESYMIAENIRAILLDTKGPEIRTGKLRNDHSGHETVLLEVGRTITLHTSEHWADAGSTEKDLYVNYKSLHKSVVPGMKVLLDDGAVILTVQSIEENKDLHGSVVCTVDNTGELRSRAGVNLPGAETDLPAMSGKDKVDIKYGMTKDVDYVAASFIQNAEGVREIRRYMRECSAELGWDPIAPLPKIISKIESVSALKNFDAILEESDGIMVARGDLGVEIPIQQVTNAQKEMVAACNAVGKPVIVATQMLESMAKNPRPTRAEVADVTNAVYDGADAVMLSGETAKGRYPVESVKMMNEIILGAERFAASRSDLVGNGSHGSKLFSDNKCGHRVRTPGMAISKSAVTAAAERGASAILVLTSTGDIPRLVAAFRPYVPIVAFCPSAKIGRQLMVHRGVHPVVGLDGVSLAKKPSAAIRDAKNMGFVESGDNVVVVGNEPDADVGTFGAMRVATVP